MHKTVPRTKTYLAQKVTGTKGRNPVQADEETVEQKQLSTGHSRKSPKSGNTSKLTWLALSRWWERISVKYVSQVHGNYAVGPNSPPFYQLQDQQAERPTKSATPLCMQSATHQETSD